MIQPLNNHCLVEVINEYDGVIGSDKNQNVQKGVLKEVNFFSEHLTASTGYHINAGEHNVSLNNIYKPLLGKIVYWQEYADAGSKFDIDGKQFVLVPFYRLIGFDDETTKAKK